MKKVVKILLIVFCFLTILLVTFVDASTGKVTAKRVRLRRDNNTKADIITNINKDEKVEILGEKDNWYNVKYKNFTGYVSKDYIEIIEEQVTDTTNITEPEKEKEDEATNSEQAEDKVQEEVIEESVVGKQFKLQKDTSLRLNPNFY